MNSVAGEIRDALKRKASKVIKAPSNEYRHDIIIASITSISAS